MNFVVHKVSRGDLNDVRGHGGILKDIPSSGHRILTPKPTKKPFSTLPRGFPDD